MKAATKPSKRGVPAAKPTNKPAAKKPAAKKPATKKPAAKKPAAVRSTEPATGHVLLELKALAKELNKAAKDLGKNGAGNPKEVSAILGSVERMTADAATKSLIEAESAKMIVAGALEKLGKDWNRRDIETALRGVTGHLTNIMVAQEFQDLAGQALRKATKALVGAIIVVEGGGPTEEQRLSQKDVDSLLRELMP
jgi:chemotaxis regulatin CheY-phosphate phosphatase CheZ